MNTGEDLEWLYSTHLKHVTKSKTQKINSFVIFGNEDSPSKIELYEKKLPEYNDYPIYTALPDDMTGEFVVTRNPKRKKK